ncbi:hypothetical protein BCN_P157 (plasmid) [Bacillus cereus NC7401]|nr:hypothetical protein BCN_P157 [Bacillus cereus NC7401]
MILKSWYIYDKCHSMPKVLGVYKIVYFGSRIYGLETETISGFFDECWA